MDNRMFFLAYFHVLNDFDDDFRRKFIVLELWYHDLNP